MGSTIARGALLLALATAFGSGCSMMPGAEPEETIRIDLVAVLPIREVLPQNPTGERPILETHAGRAVTAQVYGILAEQSRYRFAPDLTVDDLVLTLETGDQLATAREVAEELSADAVLFGKVYRFQERVGTRYAASRPASVSFDLSLYLAAKDEVVWTDQFDETQEALSNNLLNAWMFWRAGPHWFSARELTRLGVEKMFETIPDSVSLEPGDLLEKMAAEAEAE